MHIVFIFRKGVSGLDQVLREVYFYLSKCIRLLFIEIEISKVLNDRVVFLFLFFFGSAIA